MVERAPRGRLHVPVCRRPRPAGRQGVRRRRARSTSSSSTGAAAALRGPVRRLAAPGAGDSHDLPDALDDVLAGRVVRSATHAAVRLHAGLRLMPAQASAAARRVAGGRLDQRVPGRPRDPRGRGGRRADRRSSSSAASDTDRPVPFEPERAAQQSKANQHNSLRSRWSSSTSSRISSGSWARCHWHSRRPRRHARLGRRRPRGPDRVGRGTELVGRHVAHRRGLAGGVRGMPRAPAGPWPRRWHGRPPCGPLPIGTSPRAQARPGRSPVADGRPPAAPPRRGAARAARSRPPTPRAGGDRRPGGCRRDAR